MTIWWWFLKKWWDFLLSAEKWNKILNTVWNLWQKTKNIYDSIWNTKYVWKTLKASLDWAKEMWKYSVASKWDMKSDDFKTWALFWGDFHIWGKALFSTWNYLTKKLPEKLMVTNLVNLSNLKNINKRLSKLG